MSWFVYPFDFFNKEPMVLCDHQVIKPVGDCSTVKGRKRVEQRSLAVKPRCPPLSSWHPLHPSPIPPKAVHSLDVATNRRWESAWKPQVLTASTEDVGSLTSHGLPGNDKTMKNKNMTGTPLDEIILKTIATFENIIQSVLPRWFPGRSCVSLETQPPRL